ncbi:MAG: endopeptidase La [Oscillospiraceae bacterium]
MSRTELIKEKLPIVALRGLVVFPNMVLHFDVAREKSIAAVRAAMEDNQQLFLITQIDVKTDDPSLSDLFKIGVVVRIRQIVRLPNSKTLRVVVEGIRRAEIEKLDEDCEYLCGMIKEKRTSKIASKDKDMELALVRHAKDIFDQYSDIAPKMPPDVMLSIMTDEKAGSLSDYIASVLTINFVEKQKILDELNSMKRLENICTMLTKETELLEIEDEIAQRVSEQVDKNQKDYYLREQMKAISIELNDGEDEFAEIEGYREKIMSLESCDEDSKQKLLKECDRLARMGASSSAEATVVRNYITTCLSLPWGKYTKDNLDLSKAQKILDKDHYGLNAVKDRIIELLAVRKLSPDITGQIVCLVGPPGVGKTSIARSLAKAMNREYARISLGGIRDEAEIRGHRKTYIGSMPGRIINALVSSKSSNPLILLDEIDKLGTDYKGDPSSALLEALDGEQNFAFVDHYIEIPYDLSKVLFITTANDKSTIPAALLDRMEVIELYSYTHEEKFNIAKNHLVTKELKAHGLKASNLKITDESLRQIIDGYTREAGVRKLERQIAKVCRKAAVGVAKGEMKKMTLKPDGIEAILGPIKYKDDNVLGDEIGAVNGLAWTSVGGEMLKIEVVIMNGKGNLELTGSLGDVMKESAKAAISYIRSRAVELGIDENFYKDKDIHIHVPEGAVPKDGPSAGVTITTALVSALTRVPVKGDVAMTGEITLRGKVLPIGGLKEKSMAAYRAGIKTIIIPSDNSSDIAEIDNAVKSSVHFIPAKTLDDVLEIALIKSQPSVKIDYNKSIKKDVGVSYEI